MQTTAELTHAAYEAITCALRAMGEYGIEDRAMGLIANAYTNCIGEVARRDSLRGLIATYNDMHRAHIARNATHAPSDFLEDISEDDDYLAEFDALMDEIAAEQTEVISHNKKEGVASVRCYVSGHDAGVVHVPSRSGRGVYRINYHGAGSSMMDIQSYGCSCYDALRHGSCSHMRTAIAAVCAWKWTGDRRAQAILIKTKRRRRRR